MIIDRKELYNLFKMLLAFEFSLVLVNLFPSPLGTLNYLTNLTREGGIATWFSGSQLLVLSLASFANRRLATQPRARYGWLILGLLFLYLSADETAAIHESISPPLYSLLANIPYLPGTWQVVFAPLIFLGTGFLCWFLFSQFRQERKVFLWACVGLTLWILSLLAEAVAAKTGFLIGETPKGILFSSVEEFCEMAGASCFLLSLGLWRVSRTQATS